MPCALNLHLYSKRETSLNRTLIRLGQVCIFESVSKIFTSDLR